MNEIFVCSHCAVNFAEKGKKVKKIEKTESHVKAKKIENFFEELKYIEPRVQTLIFLHGHRVQLINSHYSKQLEKLEKSAEFLIRFIEKQKENAVYQLKNFYDTSLKTSLSQLNQNKGFLKNLENLHSDIYKNIDNIVINIELKDFSEILNHHKKRLIFVQKEVNESQKIADNFTGK